MLTPSLCHGASQLAWKSDEFENPTCSQRAEIRFRALRNTWQDTALGCVSFRSLQAKLINSSA